MYLHQGSNLRLAPLFQRRHGGEPILKGPVKLIKRVKIAYSFLTHESSAGRFASHCNRAVAMENQHALRESVHI